MLLYRLDNILCSNCSWQVGFQAKIYGKTLRLTKLKSDDDTLTHLLTEDAVNIMSGFWVGHYLWAIPLKIALLMVLLYRYLGVAALIGSAVTIFTLTPLQLLIGRKMSSNTKILSVRGKKFQVLRLHAKFFQF